jgi:integrase
MKRANGEGSVYERGDGKGYVGEVVLDGRRRRCSATTKQACAAKLRSMIREHERTGVAPDGKTSVRQLVELWRDKELPSRRTTKGKRLARTTIERFTWHCDLIIEHCGARPLRRLSADDVEAMMLKLAKRPVRPLGRSSLVGLRSTFGQVLHFGERRGLVDRNVARIAVIPHQAHDEAPKEALDAEQSRRLWEIASEHRLGAMWRLGMMVAARPGELAGLMWSSVDLDSATPSITLSREVIVEHGKPKLAEGVKTDGSYRTLGIGEVGVELLRAHRTAQAAERLASGRWRDHDLVFATTTGGVLDPANVRRDLAKLCATHELRRVLPNELRHTGASLMLDGGMTMDDVADVMGHSTTRMLRARYRHHLRPVLDDHVSVVEGVFGGLS